LTNYNSQNSSIWILRQDTPQQGEQTKMQVTIKDMAQIQFFSS
jgi:CRISPR/Cas system-associated protein endoribonuclease Cas2